MIMNIEKTISEHAVSDILTPMLESQDRIVTEDVAPLFDQATGLDTPPASGTVTTTIEESRSVIIAIIRKAWTATLTMLGGASVLSSIAAAYTYLRNRLQGNETYGIPDRRSEFSVSSPLAANLALLNDRKIGGVPEAADGMSLANLLGGAYNDVEELTDDNRGWTIRTDLINTLKSLFPNLTKLSLGFKTAGSRIGSNLSTITELTFPGFELQTDGHLLEGNIGVEDLTIPVVQIKSTNNWTQSLLHNNGTTKILRCTGLKYMTNNIGQAGLDSSKILVYDCNGIEEIYAEDLEEFCSNPNGAGGIASGAPNLKKVVVGNIRIWHCPYAGPYFFDNFRGLTYDNLLHLEFKSLNCSLNLKNWTAANVISHQDFLPNFRDYIALRLKGGYPIGQGPILTLSQAVRNAIHAAESTYGIENIIITQKGWTISPAPN